MTDSAKGKKIKKTSFMSSKGTDEARQNISSPKKTQWNNNFLISNINKVRWEKEIPKKKIQSKLKIGSLKLLSY